MTLRNFQVELPNGSDGDSMVLVRRPLEGQTLLFDAGDPRRLPRADVLRLAHIFVSHCHIDHFIGFDALVRPRVCLSQQLTVHGPPGFLDRVEARLAGYTWNLTDGNHFVLDAREVSDRRVACARFASGRGFRREPREDEPRTTVVWSEKGLTVTCAPLDHRIVSMGWALTTPPVLNVNGDVMAALGLTPGPWLADLKRLAADPAGDPMQPLVLANGTTATLGALRSAILRETPGERVAYVTDTLFTEATQKAVVELAKDADLLVCEAPFLSSELDKATRSHHLTAQQTGILAAAAGVKRLLLFHISDRYHGVFDAHLKEAGAAAGAGVEVEVRRELPIAG